jgi:hypothetical protein
MATENVPQTNGSYTSNQGYAGGDQNNYPAYNSSSQATANAPTTSSTSTTATSQQDVSKDEVGWYFVEQYYTTLSRTPERLYLFYNKRSQFVSGQETDKVDVCVGQRAINDKIQELDFQDCKVRVTNVDSQASDSNIVIQVIGEISNKSQPHKKFTQTFVLATQTNGYFVLNDIFRYLAEDDEEAEVETHNQPEETQASQVSAPIDPEPKTLADPVAVETVDKSLEETAAQDKSAEEKNTATVNGDDSAAEGEKEPAATPVAVPTEGSKQAPTGESEPKSEVPKEPEPTRAATPVAVPAAKPAPATKPAAPVPAVPKTWATLAAAANKVATPIIPNQSSAAPKQPKPSAPSATVITPANQAGADAASTTSATTTPTSAPTAPAAKDGQDEEWTAVGGSHNRQTSRQVAPAPVEPQQYRGYIKNVSENIAHDELKAQLEQFGELAHFDIARAPKVR